MKQRLLLISALLLIGVSALAQPDLGDSRSAEMIFLNEFEVLDGLSPQQAYNAWAKTPIDTIHEIEYYSRLGTGSIPVGTDIYGGSTNWEIFAVRTDSTSSEWTNVNPGDGIIMFNGVYPTSSADEIRYGVYDNDYWYIVSDDGSDINRINAFNQYGEDGGKYYFQWTTGDLSFANSMKYIKSMHYSINTHSVMKYRRALYVRGLDIKDETSYRLTFYIKVDKVNERVSWGPKLYADVMRGYHHQNQAFSMGCKSGKCYSLEMNPEDIELGKWQKVTMMTYYINDHEADGYVFYNGDYSGWDDDWTWRPSDEQLQVLGRTLDEGDSLRYIKQPDKFYVRFSMCTDSMVYSLDNVSLTKSWIAGAEYYNDMLRIDFGYETNLKDIVAAEKAMTNMPVVQLEDKADKYIEVWGLLKNGDPNNTGNPNDSQDFGDWEKVYIRSAEYHEDGYLYMFAEHDALDQPFAFADKYDKVYVTFRNPVDKPELTLKYTGSYYPKPLDENWVANGKIVPDFYNELATPNPYAFVGVSSMEGLPPIMMKAPYEDGAFGLPANTTELRFKFSRRVMVDQVYHSDGNCDSVVVKVGEEFWKTAWDNANSELVVTRPDNYTFTPLKGDKEIKIIHIYAKNAGQGEDVTLHYHFDEFSTTISTTQIDSDWRSEAPTVLKGYNPASTYVHDYSTTFRKGDNTMDHKGKSRVYAMSEVYPYNCGYKITNYSHSTGEDRTANVYTIVHFDKAEDCIIQFRATGWTYSGENLPNVTGYLYFYKKPNGDLSDGDGNGYATLEAVENKTELGTFTPETFVKYSEIEDKDTGTWPNDVETFPFNFTVPEAGDYVFEWVTKDGNRNGVFISNFSISSANAVRDLSTEYVKKLVHAVKAAQEKCDATTASKYHGGEYAALNLAINQGGAYVGNYPSQYDSVVTHIGDCVSALNLNIETVDLYYTTEQDVATKLNAFTGDSVKYRDLVTYKALETHLSNNETWNCANKTTEQIKAEIEAYEKEMAAIDDRMALMDKFATKLAEAKVYKDAQDKRADFDEYETFVASYNAGVTAQAVITNSDAEYKVSYDAFIEAKKGYIFKFDRYIAKTRQIKELFALAADSLGYDFASFGGKENVKAMVDALMDEHPGLGNVLREATILQILKIYEENDAAKIAKIKNLDVSALIPNYYLYNEAQIGRDLEKNSSGQWYLKKDVTNKTAIPNWKIVTKSSRSDMKWYFTMASTSAEGENYVAKSYVDWETEGHVFIGGLRSATYTSGVLSQKIMGLPHGYYKVGLNCYNATSDLEFDFKAVTDTTAKVTVLNGGSKNLVFKDLMVESVLVDDVLNYKIEQKSSSLGEFDMRSAVLRLQGPDPEYDYDLDVMITEARLNSALQQLDLTNIPETYDLYMNNIVTDAGSEIVIPVRMGNSSSITAFSLDVVLPNGVTFVSARLNNNRINGHTLSTNVTNNWSSNTVSLACLSMNNNALYYSDGDVVYLTLQLSDDMDGDYNIVVNNKEMVSPDNTVYNPSSSLCTLTVMASYEPGDVNDDGRISIADAVGVVSFIINSNTNGLNCRAADANKDGVIDVADVVWVVNKVIRRSSYAPLRGAAKSEISSSVALDDVVSALNMSLNVRIEGMQYEVTAVQFNMALPKDVSVKGVTTDDDHMAVVQKQDDGTYMVVCLSLNNSTFAGGGKSALTFELESNNASVGGEVSLKDVLLVTPGGLKKSIESVRCNLCGDGLTGIRGIDDDGNANMYDMQGRLINSTNGIYIRDGKKRVQMK